jgi:hypothetical protein
MVHQVASAQEFKELTKSDLVVVDFTATWCMLSEILNTFAIDREFNAEFWLLNRLT